MKKKVCKKYPALILAGLMVMSLMLTACDGEVTIAVSGGDESEASQLYETISYSDSETDLRSETEEDESERITLRFDAQFEQNGVYEDKGMNITEYSYRVPIVEGADTPYIDRVNHEMDEIIANDIQPELDSMADGEIMVIWKVDYECTYYNGIYSLCVYVNNNWGVTRFQCYNFDDDGNEADNQMVLEAVGLTEETFLEQVENQMTDVLDIESYDWDQELVDAFDEVAQKTMASDNLNVDMPLHVSYYGHLYYAIKQFSMGGEADYYYMYMIPAGEAFSDVELGEMALDYCEYLSDYRSEYYDVQWEDDGMVTIEVYDQVDGQHAPSDWFTVDPETGVGDSYGGLRVYLTLFHVN